MMIYGLKRMVTPVILLILGFMLWNARGELSGALELLSLEVFILLIILQIITLGAIALQWKYLFLAGNITGISLMTIIKINLAAKFVESITPSSKLGGETAKFYLYKRNTAVSAAVLTAVTGTQKAITLLTFFLLCLPSLTYWPYRQGWLGDNIIQADYLLSASWLMILAAVILNFVGLAYFKLFFSDIDLREKINLFFQETAVSFKKINRPGSILTASGIAFFFWLLYPLKTYILLNHIFAGITPGVAVAATLLAYLVSIFPLTPGGLGGFELTMALVLSRAGLSLGEGLTAALLLRSITFWLPLFLSALAALELSSKGLKLGGEDLENAADSQQSF